MTTPFEQDWVFSQEGFVFKVCERNGRDVLLLMHHAPLYAGRLAAAAPDVARALAAFLPERNAHTVDCGSMGMDEATCSTECGHARRALRKAGVLP